MKQFNRYTQLLLFSILLLSCNKDESILAGIQIESSQDQYNVNDNISISIINRLEETAFHFKCDNFDLSYSHILKYEAANWEINERALICTTFGPMGFWGTINTDELKKDSIHLSDPGLYKLKYTFILDADTSFFYSNKFEVLN